MDSNLAQARALVAAEYVAAAAPVLQALASAGFVVNTVADLYRTKRSYKRAIPILIEWLPSVTDSRVKEDMVRALTDRSAKRIAAAPLIREFRAADPQTPLGWSIGNALSVAADDSVFDELVELAQDRRYGTARQMLAVGIGTMKDPRAAGVLLGLLDDSDVAGHAVMGLGKLKAREAMPALEARRDHPVPWIRKEVAKALAKIGGD